MWKLDLQDSMKHHQTRFLTQKPAKVVLSSMEVVAQSMGFKTHIRNFKVDTHLFLLIMGISSLITWVHLVFFLFFQVLSCNFLGQFLRLVLISACMYVSDEGRRSLHKQDFTFLCNTGGKFTSFESCFNLRSTLSVLANIYYLTGFRSCSYIFHGRRSESSRWC